MLYYKVPVVNGVTDCSAGSILCCAYPQDGYMVCKFESVAKVGSGWVKITAEEFEANCPEFPYYPPDDDDETGNAVLYTPQTLTEAQQRQARANIGVSDPVPQGYCSYGGVVLPRLPESEFPCAFIYSTDVERFPYGVFFTQAPVTYDGRYLNLDGIVGRWHYNEHDGWCSYGEYDATGHLSSDPIIWTSHDILDKSGNLYLAASQPVGQEENGCKTIDLDTYGETPISLIVGSLFQQGGGTMENADVGNLMEDLTTERPLRVQFTFGVNLLYVYGVSVGRVNGKAVQLSINAMFTHQGKTYLVYASIDAASADEDGKANISMSVEVPGALQAAAADMEAILNAKY